jgi:hypothetical protein
MKCNVDLIPNLVWVHVSHVCALARTVINCVWTADMVGLVRGASIRSNRVATNIACHGGLLLAHFAVELLYPVANGSIKGLLLIKRLGRLRNDTGWSITRGCSKLFLGP